MNEEYLKELYFDWMYEMVYDFEESRSYTQLFHFLHNTEFTYLIDLDQNREADGVDLRIRFAYERDIPYEEIEQVFDMNSCSVLEMMVALAKRCEETIMDDIYIGDRTSQWFWTMIASLGLGNMDDEHFDYEKAQKIISRFLNREYDRTGRGGLFTIPRCRYDLRDVEIWYQMLWYLEDIL